MPRDCRAGLGRLAQLGARPWRLGSAPKSKGARAGLRAPGTRGASWGSSWRHLVRLWWSAPDPFSGRSRGRGERTADLGRRQKLGPREVTRFREALSRAPAQAAATGALERGRGARTARLGPAPECSARRLSGPERRQSGVGGGTLAGLLIPGPARWQPPGCGERLGWGEEEFARGRAQLLQLSGGGERRRRGEEERNMDCARLWLGLLLPVVAALDFSYHHQPEMERFLKSITQNYSSITHLHSIGKSVEDIDFLG
ncbi:hypothetical protein J1605_008675 [Eschrichtius robustus]|uniref:Uncharacterized protein n=1 Tax=Eschrichtius robustus TaxID=9764 RepID=A0AB34GSZ4_ESCRO|nr:hypothetical protein J1605_008675 [Eschrichtius robustus]